MEEVEHQWADRVLEHLNNVGGKQRVVQKTEQSISLLVRVDIETLRRAPKKY